MMNIKGIAISNGIIEGSILIKTNTTVYEKYSAPINILQQIELYHNSLDTLQKEFHYLQTHSQFEDIGLNEQLVKLYISILKDPIFTKEIPLLIQNQSISAYEAINQKLQEIEKQFQSLDNEYFRARYTDLSAIGTQLIHLISGNKIFELTTPSIIAAESFSAAELLQLPHQYILGILTEKGGKISHAAILAESLGIPAVFGIENLGLYIHNYQKAIINGYYGTVVLEPTKEISDFYKMLKEKYHEHHSSIINATQQGILTLDKQKVEVLANIGNFQDITTALQNNADGVGLFRTEILLLAQDTFLSEDEQLHYYRDMVIAMQNKPIAVRTLDIGGDKCLISTNVNGQGEPNPVLGFRSTRQFIENPEYLKQQFKALIHTYKYNNNMKIFVPFVTTLEDVLSLKKIFMDCYYEIHPNDEKCPIPFGIMIEVPAVILCLEDFLPHVDFVSLGTNDLTQYTLAADRDNPYVENYYQLIHPSILKLVASATEKAAQYNVPISICGEIAKEKLFIRLLLGIGLRSFSMSPVSIPIIKYIISYSKTSECHDLWKEISTMTSQKDIIEYLEKDLNNFSKQHDIYFDQQEEAHLLWNYIEE
ncbi:MAG: phosphoenolpyruvate--protein phosphotransferase [Brevinemataceae bacterium]